MYVIQRSLVVFSLLGFLQSYAQNSGTRTYFQQKLDYRIEVALDDQNHLLTGKEKLTYVNHSPDTLHEIYFHLYWNAYRAKSYMKRDRKQTIGSIDIVAMKDSRGEEVPREIDDTIMRARLHQPIPPGASEYYEIQFIAKIPPVQDRAGHYLKHYDIGQWYPKPAVYDRFGWHADYYLANGEFYGEWADYEVNITLPKGYVVGATGDCLNFNQVFPDSIESLATRNPQMDTSTVNRMKQNSTGKENQSLDELFAEVSKKIKENGITTAESKDLITWKFKANRVHDFAWTADRHYKIARFTGPDSVTVNVYYLDYREKEWEPVLEWAKRSVAYYNKMIGRYPYKQITVADTYITAGGIEFPNIVMINDGVTESGRFFPLVIFHEIAHNWFYGLVASNESRYAWMDEGFATFMEVNMQEQFYDRSGNLTDKMTWWEKLVDSANDDRTEQARQYLLTVRDGWDYPINTHSDRFPYSYVNAAYSKPASVLFSLQYVLGDSVFWKGMQNYFEEWKFQHPYPEDFYSVMERTGGRDLGWFFDEWINTSKYVDYGITSFHKSPEQKNGKRMWKTEVKMKRYGQAEMPLDLRLTALDGSPYQVHIPVDLNSKKEKKVPVLNHWNYADRIYTAKIFTEKEIASAEIDPSLRLLDVDQLNNTSGRLPKIVWRWGKVNNYTPPLDRYSLNVYPKMWYNDVDGPKVSLSTLGSYLYTGQQLQTDLWLSSKSGRVDYTINYSTPVTEYENRLTFNTHLVTSEGREAETISVRKNLDSAPGKRIRQNGWISLNHTKLFDSKYLFSPALWSKGHVNYWRMAYELTSPSLNSSVEAEGNLWRSDYLYNKISGEISGQERLDIFYLGIRLFVGTSSGSGPVERQYFLAGASPWQEFSNRWLKSVGTLPIQWSRKGHLHQGGGPSLRGYTNQDVFGQNAISLNSFFDFPNPLTYIRKNIPFLTSQLALIETQFFFDVGRVWDAEGNNRINKSGADGGIGLTYDVSWVNKLDQRLTIRLDFPFWVSDPVSGEKHFEPRWILGIGRVF